MLDNEQLWEPWAGNLFWSTGGLHSGVPLRAAIANPLLTGAAGSAIEFREGSPARRMGIAPLLLVEQDRGVGGGQ